MGNKLRRKAKTIEDEQNYIVDFDDKKILEEYWPILKNEHPDLFVMSVVAVLRTCPAIAKVFGTTTNPEEALKNAKLVRTIDDLDDFFDQLVVKHRLKLKPCKQLCHDLGARHICYSQTGFRTFYWDVFTVNFVQSLEEELGLKGRRRFEVVMAWRKFIQTVVEEVRQGYQEQVARKIVRNALSSTSSV